MSHTAEVLGLAWNRQQRNFLASASADQTVRLWDLTTGESIRAYSHHTDKVQNVMWNPAEKSVLLTGSFDRTAAAFDARDPTAIARWTFDTDVSAAMWNPHSPHLFLATTDSGFVYACDTRRPGATVFTLEAHDAAITSMAFSPGLPGCLVTADVEQTLKMWDISGGKPTLVHGRELNTGPIYTVGFAPESPFVMAAGGHQRGLKIIDWSENSAVRRHFGRRNPEAASRGEAKAQRRAEEAAAGDGEAREAGQSTDEEALDQQGEEAWSEILRQMDIQPSEETLQADRAAAKEGAAVEGQKPKAKAKKAKKKKKKPRKN